MAEITPPYDFPPAIPGPGQKAQQIAALLIQSMRWFDGPSFNQDALASVVAAIIAWQEARK